MAKELMQPNWSELPSELLGLIFERLAFVDKVCAKAVCHSWNIDVLSYQLWLMFPRNPKHKEPITLDYFNVTENRFYNVNTNVFRGVYEYAYCVGSRHGWIVVEEEDGNTQLLNPFSGDTINLPPMNSLIIGSKIDECKILLSSDPRRSEDYIVVASHGSCGVSMSLSFYKPGDNKWTTTKNEYSVNEDIIFHNGKMYGLCFGALYLWDFYNPPTKLDVEAFQNNRGFLSHFYNLVESLGEFLIVEQRVKWSVGYVKWYTVGLNVFKLDLSGKKWIPIRTLPGRAILLDGTSGAICISIQDFPELEENSIYFLEDCLGVYNFKEQRVIGRHEYGKLDTHHQTRHERPIWWSVMVDLMNTDLVMMHIYLYVLYHQKQKQE